MSLKLAKLNDERTELLDRAEAINNLAEQEKRELTAEETAEIDAIVGVGKPGEKDYKPGSVAAIDDKIAREEKLQAAMKNKALKRAESVPANGSEGRILIPANVRRHGNLKAFAGQNAHEEAYAAGRWYMACLGHDGSREWCNEHGLSFQNALGTGSNTGGGALVPNPLENTLIRLVETFGVFRQKAFVWPMTSDTDTIPRRTGGMTAYFVSQNPSTGTTESDPTFDNVNLAARELCAATRVSKNFSEDTIIAWADLLTKEIALAFANKEDSCGFLGDGTSTYGGIVGIKNALADGSEVTAATGNTGFATLDLEDFLAMVAKLPQYPGIKPEWYIHSTGYALSMQRLMLAAGGNTVNDIASGGKPMFLGAPVNFVQVMNSTTGAQTSTEGLCYYGDLSLAAAFGNRIGMSVEFSDQRYIELNQIGVFGRERFDIKVHEVGTASVAGPLIGLETPGS